MDEDASTVLDSQSVISESKRGKIMVGNTIQKVNVIPVTGNQSMETHLTPSASSNVDQIPSGKTFVNWNQYPKHTKMQRLTEVTKCQYITFIPLKNVSL